MTKEQNAFLLMVALSYQQANELLVDHNEPLKIGKMTEELSLNEATQVLLDLTK